MPLTTRDDTAVAQEIAAYVNFVRGNYFNLSARVLYLWDYCVTFNDEVRYIWKGKKTPATLLFLINRYVNLLITIFEFFEQATFQTTQSCGPFVRLIQSLVILSLFIVAVFVTLRVYATWNFDWKPALPVLLLALVSPILNIIVDADLATQTAPPPSLGCALRVKIPLTTYSKLVIASRSTTTAYDGLALLLTAIRSVQLQRRNLHLGVGTGIMRFLLKDGALYFLALFCINIAQIVLTSVFPGNDNISFYVAPITSVLISRFLLELRQVAKREEDDNATPVFLTTEVASAHATTDMFGMASLAGPTGFYSDSPDLSVGNFEELRELTSLKPRDFGEGEGVLSEDSA